MKESLQKEQTSNGRKIDLEGLLLKKQSIFENSVNKQSSIRTKVFSLKTPNKEDQSWKEGTDTKDITSIKIDSSSKKPSERQYSIK